MAIPTETVYGLGANGCDATAVSKIFEAKGRPQDNPLILHIGAKEQVSALVTEIPEVANRLMDVFWPGPLTIILNRSDRVPDNVTAGGPTVGIRMPSHPWTQQWLAGLPVPVAAPSANRSGRPSPTDANAVLHDMDGVIPLVIDGGDASIGLESTVIDMTGEPTILRPGFITQEDLEQVLGTVRMDPHLENEAAVPRAPGQKYRHYAPMAKVRIYDGDDVTDLASPETLVCVFGDVLGLHLYSLGKRDNLAEMAHALFRVFRAADDAGYKEIWVPAVEKRGWGYAIMNRLEKAAGGSQ